MNIGVIGVGKMGHVLCHALLESNAIESKNLHITKRSSKRSKALQHTYPTICVHENLKTLLEEVEIVFICLRPLDIHPLLTEHSSLFKNKMVVSITSPITVEEIASVIHTNIARVVPSITNQTRSGITLVTFHPQCQPELKQKLLTLLRFFSTPVIVNDETIRISSDITSCGPAFISSLLRKWMEQAELHTDINRPLAEHFMREMIIGFGKLIENEYDNFTDLERTVIVKGGVTGEGIHIIEQHAPPLFEKLVLKTQEKFAEDRKKINQQFSP